MANFNTLNQNEFNGQLERRPVPTWICDLEDLASFPLHQILKNSLFYPAAGVDGRPVQYLAGHIHSFVYADYGVDQAQVLNATPFEGYEVLHRRVDMQCDKVYPSGLEPLDLIPEDGNPQRNSENRKPFFAIWTIYKRDQNLNDAHGPELFSLLYICDDGPTVYHNLYRRNMQSAYCLAIIRPGTGFGLNWTDFRRIELILGREVVDNPNGVPQLLLQDDHESYWPQRFNIRLGKWGQIEEFSLWERQL